jgi:glycine/D-amino acid oxidase-like deaminating enzyme
MNQEREYDAIVIGAGIVGAACGAELVREGLKVLVLDRGRAGCGGASATMGHIIVMDGDKAQLDLTLYSRKLWHELVREYPLECSYLGCGTLWVAADQEEMEAACSKAETFKEYNIGHEILEGDRLYQAEPNLRKGLAGGLRVIDDCSVYPATCVKLFLEGLEVRENCRVQEIQANTVILQDGEELHAKVIVNAAGVMTGELTKALPIRPRKGHLLITDRYPGFCSHQILELGYLKSTTQMDKESVAFNIHPRSSGQFILGSSREFSGLSDEVNRAVLGRMIERACEYMPELAKLSAIRCWCGFRPATPDKLPYIGKWPGIEGLYIAAGHEGLGITTSLGTAKILAAEILGKEPAIDPAPYRPVRVLEKSTT